MSAALDMRAVLEMFRSKAEAAGAAVHAVADEPAARALLDASAPGAAAAGSLAERFPALAAGLPRAADAAPGSAPEVAAAGLFGVAETGSVAVREARADRGACWLAERLWLLVPSAEVEPSLDGALARVGALVRGGAGYVTLVTGPSRTADIERTLTIGVHGPRAVAVVLVGRA
jgi:L-lactate dehydrogenase complex protein LldG